MPSGTMIRRRAARLVPMTAGSIICAAALMLPSSASADTTSCGAWASQKHSTSFRDGKLSGRVCLGRTPSRLAYGFVQFSVSGDLQYKSINGYAQVFAAISHKAISPLQGFPQYTTRGRTVGWFTRPYRVGTQSLLGHGKLVFDVKDDGKSAFTLELPAAVLPSLIPPSCGRRCN